MVMPNLLQYYWASHIQKVIFWVNGHSDENVPDWVTAEPYNFPIHSLVSSA